MTAHLRGAFEHFMNVLIDRIIVFTDYFIVEKHITLSEAALFAFGITRALWYLLVGYTSPFGDFLPSSVWITIFTALAAAHFISFTLHNLLYRSYVASAYAFVWCLLTVLSAISEVRTSAAPIFGVLTFLSVFIAARLFHEHKNG